MGADYSAYLYYGIRFEELFKLETKVEEYDIHDIKTGKPTGKKGKETNTYLVLIPSNKNLGKVEGNSIEASIPFLTDMIHYTEQGANDIIFGFAIERVDEDGFEEITKPASKGVEATGRRHKRRQVRRR